MKNLFWPCELERDALEAFFIYEAHFGSSRKKACERRKIYHVVLRGESSGVGSLLVENGDDGISSYCTRSLRRDGGRS